MCRQTQPVEHGLVRSNRGERFAPSLERAKEKYPQANARIISASRGMTRVRTSQFYPQSNGKIERWHKSLKQECIRKRPKRTVLLSVHEQVKGTRPQVWV
jgi:transposase InsO family protein